VAPLNFQKIAGRRHDYRWEKPCRNVDRLQISAVEFPALLDGKFSNATATGLLSAVEAVVTYCDCMLRKISNRPFQSRPNHPAGRQLCIHQQ